MSVINRSELLNLHEKLGKQARELMTAKNHDYAVEQDVFRNFRTFGTLGVLVRLSDKLARLRSFEENNKFAVSDEKLIDTILDTINYAVIYYAMKQEQAPEPLHNIVHFPAFNVPFSVVPTATSAKNWLTSPRTTTAHSCAVIVPPKKSWIRAICRCWSR